MRTHITDFQPKGDKESDVLIYNVDTWAYERELEQELQEVIGASALLRRCNTNDEGQPLTENNSPPLDNPSMVEGA